MNSVQESKHELEAAIRYAENAISSAKGTIESLEFRQQMAQKNYQEQTGREQALQTQVTLLEERVKTMEYDLTAKTAQAEAWKKEVDKLRSEKEASSEPCGCQAYRDLEEARGRAEGEVELLQGTIKELEESAPTMPVIPKAVAIAIFREGVQHGVEAACTELEGQTITVEESEYVSNFEVSFTKEIDLDDELNLDWMRGKLGRYDEGFVTDALSNLCADKEFECRIHGVDDQEEKKND